ncbi:MAG TPA: hypothetical protein VK973_14020 [Arenicellales bacterium]|nr:hypothetical protein [Arenicellales bacterium]
MSGGRRLAANFGWLLGGRGSAAMVTLAVTVLSARELGPETFGVVILIHTAVLVIRQLCTVKTAEAVIRFGVPLRDAPGDRGWPRLLAGAVRIDMLGALLAAAVAAAVNYLAAPLLNLDPAMQWAAWAYVPALAVSASGSARGTLRVLDRYALLGILLMGGPLVRLAGILFVISAGLEAWWYVVVWAAGLFAEHVVVLLFAGRALRRELPVVLGCGMRQAFELEPRLGRFLKVVYWQSNLDVFPRQGVTLLVGAWFGAGGAGVFRLARDLAEVLGKPVALLRQAIFPDLARLWERDTKRFVQLTWRVSAAMLALGAVFVAAALVAGPVLLELLAGPAYRAGGAVLALLLGAAALELGGAALRPASYTLGREATVLAIQFCSLVVYVPVFVALAGPVGLQAAGWAAVAAAAVNLGGLTWLVRRAVRHAR